MQISLFLGLFVFIFVASMPLTAGAQYSGRGSSAYRSKINKLDDDKVENFSIPVLFGVTGRMITSDFGDSRGGGTREHEGQDILAPKGAPIVSPTEAVVVRTGTGSSSGKYVTTANPGGESFVYMHLSEILVKAGEELDEGNLIGYVGNTGNASGGLPHLHLEVRNGRRATDPFPRLAGEFSIKEKINFLEEAIEKVEDFKDQDDAEDFVEFVVKTYQGELRLAVASGIELPNDVERALKTVLPSAPASGGAGSGGSGTGGSNVSSAAAAQGDLALNSSGPLVVALQGFLIAKNTGPAARTLAAAGATGFFGPITQRALIEYQAAAGIVPASGYFGPITRAYILKNEASE